MNTFLVGDVVRVISSTSDIQPGIVGTVRAVRGDMLHIQVGTLHVGIDENDVVLHECPDCGYRGPFEENGVAGRQRSFLCTACGSQFDAVSS